MMKNGRKKEQRQRGFPLSDPLTPYTRWWGRVFLTPAGVWSLPCGLVSPLLARLANEGKVSGGDQAGEHRQQKGEGGKRGGGEGVGCTEGLGQRSGCHFDTGQQGTNWIGFLSRISFFKKYPFIWVHQVLVATCGIF